MITKNPTRIRTVFKNLTMFFLGMSCVFFAVNAFTVAPIAPNAVIFIKSIFLTKNGTNMSMTGIVLEGSGGHAWFQGDMTIASITGATVLGTDGSGKIIASNVSGIYNYLSGVVGGLGSSLRVQETGTNAIYNKNYETGFVGIGFTGPKAPLQVAGNIIGGNINNTVHGMYSSVIGGEDNHIDTDLSHIGGGKSNVVKGKLSNIMGGEINIVEGSYSAIGGGQRNMIKTDNSIIGGGAEHTINGGYSVTVGGYKNSITGGYSFLGGGRDNRINCVNSKGEIEDCGSNIVGGFNNLIDVRVHTSFIGGGRNNQIVAPQRRSEGNAIVGGASNTIRAPGSSYSIHNSTIVGGLSNTIEAVNSTINSSFAGGTGTVVAHTNTFAWNSVANAYFVSGRPNAFLINAPYDEKNNIGGVGINTANPQHALDVVGSMRASNNIYAGGSVSAGNSIQANSLTVTNNISANTINTTSHIISWGGYGTTSGGALYYGTSTVIWVMGSNSSPCKLEFIDGLLVDDNCPSAYIP